MANFSFTATGNKQPQGDYIHIDFHNGKITGNLGVITFLDKDTNSWVSYIHSLEISGYGPSRKDSIEMLRYSTEDFFDHLMPQGQQAIHQALNKFGFKRNKFFNKRFSKAFVDVEGTLQNFNFDKDSVTIASLTAA